MQQDFLPGMKVSVDNEYGVVLDERTDNGDYGLIRWDTNKENDCEDWRGLFGTFLNIGGQIIDQSFEFKFINDDGAKKHP